MPQGDMLRLTILNLEETWLYLASDESSFVVGQVLAVKMEGWSCRSHTETPWGHRL